MTRLLNKNSDLICSQESSRILALKTVPIYAWHVLYVRNVLRILQAGIKNTNPLIKNAPRLLRKNLGSLMRVFTALEIEFHLYYFEYNNDILSIFGQQKHLILETEPYHFLKTFLRFWLSEPHFLTNFFIIKKRVVRKVLCTKMAVGGRLDIFLDSGARYSNMW